MKERVTKAVTKARSYRRRLIGTAVAAVAAAAVTFMATATGATPAPGAAHPASAPIADEAPGFAVEDFNYPGADKILAEQGITLKRGDGHILLATCGSENGLIVILARSRPPVCFRATGTSGFLSLDIPAVFNVTSGDQPTQVDLTVDGETHTYDIAANASAPVGEAADPSVPPGVPGRPMALVEIRTGS